MAERRKRVDAVIIGYGWAGAIMAKALTDAGLSVVALERGPVPVVNSIVLAVD
jgi:gluconate 2-dehydrogenase alpha chain